jgi:DNA-binding XRE family transcriptional regulator
MRIFNPFGPIENPGNFNAMDAAMANANAGRMIATPAQIKAARALLGWSTADLAERMGVARNTVTRLEDPDWSPSAKTLRQATEILGAAGIIFLERDHVAGDGVRLATPRGAGVAEPDEDQ